MWTTGTTDRIERLATRDLLFELGGRLSGIEDQLRCVRASPMSARTVAAMEGARRELRRAHVTFEILHQRLIDDTGDGLASGGGEIKPRTSIEPWLHENPEPAPGPLSYMPRRLRKDAPLAAPGLDYFARDLRAIARTQPIAAGCPHNGMQVALWREGEDIFRAAAAPNPRVLDFLCGQVIARRVRDIRRRLSLLSLRQFWRAF